MTMSSRENVFVTNLFTRVGSKEKALSDTSITAYTGDVLFLVSLFVQRPHSKVVPDQAGIPAPPQHPPLLLIMVLMTLSVLFVEGGGARYQQHNSRNSYSLLFCINKAKVLFSVGKLCF